MIASGWCLRISLHSVRWMRRYLGEDENQPIRHPVVRANIGSRIMGVRLCDHPGDACDD